jgi:uncharacterized protein
VTALPSLVKDLLKPETYPHKPHKVELVQTQMSFIFLTGEYVYKVKKPVNLGYLDYTTLEKRHFFCEQELKLNRRLCSDVYLAVVPITASLQGAKRGTSLVELDGQGEAIEYTVKMKQLPQDRMMDVLLPRGEVTSEMVARVAEKLVGFHRKAQTNQEIGAFGELDVIRRNCDENFAQTEKYIGLTILRAKYEGIKSYTGSYIKSKGDLFEERVRVGRIRDCHGDLHAAHVCFTDDICIYDCIEFNDRFRYCDVASEIAFLAMDLDRYRQAGLSRHLVDTYVELSGDEGLLELLIFYKCYRAYVRGKVESFKLDDRLISEGEKAEALESARSYFQLAESYV